MFRLKDVLREIINLLIKEAAADLKSTYLIKRNEQSSLTAISFRLFPLSFRRCCRYPPQNFPALLLLTRFRVRSRLAEKCFYGFASLFRQIVARRKREQVS